MVATLTKSPTDDRETTWPSSGRSAERRVLLALLYESDTERLVAAARSETAQRPGAVLSLLAVSGPKTLAAFAAISGVHCSDGVTCAQAQVERARAFLPWDARVDSAAVPQTLRRAVCDALAKRDYDVVIVPRNGSGRRCRAALERWSRDGGRVVLV